MQMNEIFSLRLNYFSLKSGELHKNNSIKQCYAFPFTKRITGTRKVDLTSLELGAITISFHPRR